MKTTALMAMQAVLAVMTIGCEGMMTGDEAASLKAVPELDAAEVVKVDVAKPIAAKVASKVDVAPAVDADKADADKADADKADSADADRVVPVDAKGAFDAVPIDVASDDYCLRKAFNACSEKVAASCASDDRDRTAKCIANSDDCYAYAKEACSF